MTSFCWPIARYSLLTSLWMLLSFMNYSEFFRRHSKLSLASLTMVSVVLPTVK